MEKTQFENDFDRYVKELEHRKYKHALLMEFVGGIEKRLISNGFAPGHEFWKISDNGEISLHFVDYVCINEFNECGSRIIYLYWCDDELNSFNDDDIGVTVFECNEKAIKAMPRKVSCLI